MEAKAMTMMRYLHCALVLVSIFHTASCVVLGRNTNELNLPQLVNLHTFKQEGRIYERTRRDTGDEDVQKLIVNVTRFADKNHNEAIVHWSGNQSDTVFVLTREHNLNGSVPDSTLYRSTDYGTSFKVIYPDDEKKALIRYYYTSAVNKEKLIFTDVKKKYLYITENAGKNFKNIPVTFSPDLLVFHPKKENDVLAYDYRSNKLFVSDDLGMSWTPVQDFVNSRFSWGDDKYDDENSIHLEHLNQKTGKYEYQICSVPYCTDKSFNSSIPKDIDVNSLLVINEFIFVQKSTQFDTILYVSWKREPFKPTYFPLDVHPKDFNIINADDNQVFIAADTSERKVNLYLSDVTGQFYIESLQNLVVMRMRPNNFDADLYEVKGIKGVYIANVQHPRDGARSYITFDQGGEWMPLKAPDMDPNGKPYNCHLPECSLHLHMTYSLRVFGIQPPLSEKNAPGIIMAHGTVGKGLLKSDVTMFMSNDTGVSWKAVFMDNHLYNILDQGGAMVVVPQNNPEPTNIIRYSWTEGEDWEEYTFSGEKIQVDGVLNEPGITTRIVSIYGHTEDVNAGWVIVKVDFSKILSRKCDDKTDYYKWTTLDKVTGGLCILGRKFTYKRRKQDAKCYNGNDYKKAVSIIKCQCLQDDYECDFGYKESADKKSCVKESWFNPDLPPFECPEDTFYNKSTEGYRKIASDYCEGDDLDKKYKPVLTKCPIMKPQQLTISTDISQTIATGKVMNFTLNQRQGSKKSTHYTYSFGDGTANTTYNGFEAAQHQNHIYKQRGMYTVMVSAQNQKGSNHARITVHVEDAIKAIYIDEPHGAKLNYPVQFEVWPVFSNWNSSRDRNIHFLWNFGDQMDRPLLTYNQTVSHIYPKAGNYSILIEAVNSVGSVFKRTTLAVYGTLKTVQLSFSSQVEALNDRTAAWRKMFGDMLKNTLIEELEVFGSRLEVVVLPTGPTKADVSILPVKQESTKDETIDIIVNRILSKVQNGSIKMNFGNQDFGLGPITITKAVVLHDDKPTDNQKHARNLVAVFICVPILMVAIFVSFLVVLYYKKKFSQPRRYSMLHQTDAEDHLLGVDDDDDDDAPLDLNPDRGRGGHLAIDDDDDNRSDLFQPGENPSLVILCENTDQIQRRNSIDC